MKLLLFALFVSLALIAQNSATATHVAQLTWYPGAPASGAYTLVYSVYRADGACPSPEAPIGVKIASGLQIPQYSDTTILDGQTYCYQVTETYNTTESKRSNSAVAIVPGITVPSPSGLNVIVQVTVTVPIGPTPTPAALK
jgi:exo-beta-1,3-glucanase (GH17 family)